MPGNILQKGVFIWKDGQWVKIEAEAVDQGDSGKNCETLPDDERLEPFAEWFRGVEFDGGQDEEQNAV